jgi:transposase-like protein
MDFPLLEITDEALAEHWLLKYFHPTGLRCPRCAASVEQARRFRQTRRSRVTTYRCRQCDQLYTVYTGTLLAHKHWRPPQVILLLRGICKGETTASLARELELAYDTVHHLRQQIQKKAQQLSQDRDLRQPETPLPDAVTETDEMFQNAGEKRRKAQ